eukprot:EG_transcript_34756
MLHAAAGPAPRTLLRNVRGVGPAGGLRLQVPYYGAALPLPPTSPCAESPVRHRPNRPSAPSARLASPAAPTLPAFGWMARLTLTLSATWYVVARLSLNQCRSHGPLPLQPLPLQLLAVAGKQTPTTEDRLAPLRSCVFFLLGQSPTQTKLDL